LQGARELLAEAIKTGQPSVPDAFVIADEAGNVFQLVLRHFNVRIGIDLVALHDVVVGNFLAGVGSQP
jgi:hypothetical protein